MLARYGIIVYDQHAHFMRMDLDLISCHLYGFRIYQRYRHGKDCAFALFALDFDLAVHHVDDILRDGHAQP